MVDLKQHRPIELLPERDAAAVTPWLQARPGVEVIARDRAGAYAEAARTAAPDAQQVADRWHLLRNLRDAIERLMLRCTGRLREAARAASEELRAETIAAEPLPAAPNAAPVASPPVTAAQRRIAERRARRLGRYEEAVRRHRLGESIKSIARSMRLDRRTVRSFVRAGVFPERAQRAAVPMLIDAHRQHLVARAADGCRNAAHLWRELRADGFAGSYSTVRDAFASIRGTAPSMGSMSAVLTSVRTIAPPSPRRACAWLLDWAERKLNESERHDRHRLVEALCRIEPAIGAARSLAQRFFSLVRDRDAGGFDRWLAQARTCAVIELRRFAAGLEADLSAVRAAFSSPWSSGQVEGQINRLKYLKRQMYGRAKLDLLRIRVLHPN